jgi:poly(hydroxyalkanoate) depolymerase family esterase
MLNEHMRAQMREATRTLMSGGAAAATAAIQKALKGMPGDSGAAISSMPDFLRDVTLPDMNFTSGKTFGVGEAMPDIVTDLLARLGLPSADAEWRTGKNPWQPQTEIQPADEAQSDAKGGGQFLSKSFTNHAGTRSYKLYVPSSYHGQAMPLIVMLHGCTQSPDDFANGTRMNAVADEKQCLVVYPAQAQSANSSRCWNWFKSVDQKREQGEPSIIAGITREIIRNYKVDAGKVYVAGLSSGGAMAVIMGTTYPDLYAAVGVHSGLPYASARDLPSAFAAMRGSASGSHSQGQSPAASRAPSIPIIVFHGDRDRTVNACNGDKLMKQNASEFVFDGHSAAGHTRPDVIVEEGKVPNGHRYTRTSHHDEGGHAIAEHWVIHGAGHAWAGGSKSGSYTDAKGPDATREMMRFFYAQSQARQVI